MNGIIDRFEGNFCVVELEDKKIINIEMEKLPLGAKVGDVVKIYKENVFVDLGETEKRKQRIEEKAKDLWE